jgi:DNA-binding MarR family transcriptional regulator
MDTQPTAAGQPQAPARTVVDRLGPAARAGWSPIPDVLIFNQGTLGLRSEDLNVLLNLIAHWYLPGTTPFVRPTTIARRMGVSTRSVQRSIARLIRENFVAKTKHPTNGHVAYDLTPMVEKLKPLAEVRIAHRQSLREAKLAELAQAIEEN